MRLTSVVQAAVQNGLVAALLIRNRLQRVDKLDSHLTSLHLLGNDNVLNVTTRAASSDELAFDEQGTRGHHAVGCTLDDDDYKVGVGASLHLAEVREINGWGEGRRRGQDVEKRKVRAQEVVAR